MAKCFHDRVLSTCSLCRPERVYRMYQYKSAQRELTFRLTFEEFRKLVNAPCFYCGETPAMGVDRVDNRIGYLTSNVVAACVECNFMKRAMLRHKFLYRAQKIAKYQSLKTKVEAEAEIARLKAA